MARDYYDVLGVKRNASADDIKRAYRDLAMRYHPDRNKEKSAEEKFKEINAAYAVLGDPEKRKQYDTFGPEGFGQRFSQDDIFRNFDINEVLRQMGVNFEDMGFSGFGGNMFEEGMGFGQPQEASGVNVYLSFNDIERGVEREFEVQRRKVCDNCKGNGAEPGSKQSKCPTCNGRGRIQSRQSGPFGVFMFDTMCNKCKGRGKVYDKECRECRGRGSIVVNEKFRIKAEKSGKKSFFG